MDMVPKVCVHCLCTGGEDGDGMKLYMVCTNTGYLCGRCLQTAAAAAMATSGRKRDQAGCLSMLGCILHPGNTTCLPLDTPWYNEWAMLQELFPISAVDARLNLRMEIQRQDPTAHGIACSNKDCCKWAFGDWIPPWAVLSCPYCQRLSCTKCGSADVAQAPGCVVQMDWDLFYVGTDPRRAHCKPSSAELRHAVQTMIPGTVRFLDPPIEPTTVLETLEAFDPVPARFPTNDRFRGCEPFQTMLLPWLRSEKADKRRVRDVITRCFHIDVTKIDNFWEEEEEE